MIDKSKKYKFLYVSVSFKNNQNFVKFLKDHLGVEVPYIDRDDLRTDMRDSLDSYIYVEDTPKFKETYRFLNRKFPKVSFTVLGTVRGNDIFSFFGKCNAEVKRDLIEGEQYRISEGEYKNLIVKVASQTKEVAKVYFRYLSTERYLELPVSNLTRLETQVESYVFQDLREKMAKQGLVRALVIDAFDVIRRSLVYHRDKYSSTGKFVGGVFGVYFTILKLKELFPEYQILWCVDDAGEDRFLQSLPGVIPSPGLHQHYLDTAQWAKEFCQKAGFYVFASPGHRVEPVLASAVKTAKELGHNEVLIYSSNDQFHALLDENTFILSPKDSHRGNSEFIKEKDVLNLWGVNSPQKINWLKSIIGDPNVPEVIPAIGYVSVEGKRLLGIKAVDYMNFINQASSFAEFTALLSTNDRFSDFIKEQLPQNYARLSLPLDLFKATPSVLGQFEEGPLFKLLQDYSLYKEVEMWDRNSRILKSLW